MVNRGALFHDVREQLLVAGLLCLFAGVVGVNPVHADDRFGPPWMSEVAVERTAVYSQPDRGAPQVGPLGSGAAVVVIGDGLGPQGDWTRIPDGYVPSGDIAELRTPWIAEVSVPSTEVYAKPFVASGIRKAVRQGDLLMVTGVSAGLEGDTHVWWSTTEGYVGISTIRKAESNWAKQWGLPLRQEARNGWWGQIRSETNVRVGASTAAPIVGSFSGGERVKVLSEARGDAVLGSPVWYRIDGGRYPGAWVHSSLVSPITPPKPSLAPAPSGIKASSYIVVDRAHFTLTLIIGGVPQFVTYVALGQAGVDTPAGLYNTFGKLTADRMSSRNVKGATHSYDLPNVPFTQYYKDGGYAIHGTYWHDLFGTRESQGCINVTWTDAAYLFDQTQPLVAASSYQAWLRDGQEATPVLIMD